MRNRLYPLLIVLFWAAASPALAQEPSLEQQIGDAVLPLPGDLDDGYLSSRQSGKAESQQQQRNEMHHATPA